MGNRFRDPVLREIYDRCIALAHKPGGPLYTSSGNQRVGAAYRDAFWAGFNRPDLRPTFVLDGSPVYAAWRAGQDFAKTREGIL